MADQLQDILNRLTRPKVTGWNMAMRAFFILAAALLIAYLAWLAGFNPFHLRELNW